MNLKLGISLAVFYAVTALPALALEQPVKPDKAERINPLLLQKSGFQVGDFLIRPELALIGIYDNNIFATRTNEVSDHLLLISPSLNILSDWDRHQLKFSSSADLARYDENSSEDYDDFHVSTSGRYDFSKKANVFAGYNYSQGHESRASPDSF